MTDRFRRRETWASSHERARARAAERLWEVLDAGEAEWLDRHLDECRDCRTVATSYEAQRLELRALRDRQPVPPRDLWARTAAAIEREAARRRPSLRPDPVGRTPILRRRRPSPVPLGAISGLLVVAVVVGVSLLGGGRTPVLLPSTAPNSPRVAQATPSTRSIAPSGTPIVVAAGDVGWMTVGPDGEIDVFFSPIDEVCAESEGPDCAPIEEASPRTGEPIDTPPQTVLISPDDDQLVLLQGDTDGGSGKVVVVPVPTAPGSSPEPTPSAAATPPPPDTTPPPAETASPPPVETATPPPADTPAPDETPAATPSIVPPDSPTPTPSSGALEIASDVIVVGQSAGYSADGQWFGFSARPADDSHGPDIYLWRVGEPEAIPITDDHRSVFSGWLDGRLLGSRAIPDLAAAGGTPAAGTIVRPEAFLLDPATGVETVLDAAPFWRPSVDPTGSLAVYWDGTLTLADNGFDWQPGAGRLVLGSWPAVPSTPGAPGSEEAPASPSASAVPARGSTGSPVPPVASAPPAETGSPEPTPPGQLLEDTAIGDWDARWDEDGSHLAIWIADPADPTIGRLSLYVVNPKTGRLDLDEPLLESHRALPGFSIGSDRLAWATPPQQNGKGSHVEVIAWTRDASGKVESAPGDEPVVVIR
ncbi:MAG TPA: zf-HC2 domain-containing protein [Candidatus Limnocylindrales bacterium]|jgi:hypothetical protein|nr:zf-HC2 domain-containing protein [Candidatus Limnocylindrales bacterium]